MRNIIVIFVLLILSSCRDNYDKKLSKENDTDVHVNQIDNENFKIVKIDSVSNLYLIYALKSEKYFKIISNKQDSFSSNCNRIKPNELYKLDVEMMYSQAQMIQHTDGIRFDDTTTVYFEGDSIVELHAVKNMKGLCYFDR